MVALTFDDGPGLNTREIVDELNRHGVKATFFVDGLEADQPWSDTDKENLKYTYQHGHQIASHTYTHADLPKLNEGQITKEMNDISNAINEVIGVRPTFMRPPYGNLSQAVLNTLKKLGYYVVTWNADTNDWRHPHDTNASIQEFKKEFNKSPGSSFISLEHEPSPGKRIVRMDECINADAYRK
ncbi:hypothetical protein BDF22DRAFT_689618 [Syncephalis plumigaleata]|nr:hypothetical protein BDF22DRAFT_689618 [Syncephalis plumigaleata]